MIPFKPASFPLSMETIPPCAETIPLLMASLRFKIESLPLGAASFPVRMETIPLSAETIPKTLESSSARVRAEPTDPSPRYVVNSACYPRKAPLPLEKEMCQAGKPLRYPGKETCYALGYPCYAGKAPRYPGSSARYAGRTPRYVGMAVRYVKPSPRYVQKAMKRAGKRRIAADRAMGGDIIALFKFKDYSFWRT